MLTKLTIRNFKLFEEVEIELGERVVFIGPNNAGKTSALQALALWDVGTKRWLEKRGGGVVPEKRPGVTINRRDLIAVPVPVANLLWRDLHVREGSRAGGKTRTQNVLIEIAVEGVDQGKTWACGLEFDYANEESFYCRPLRAADGQRMEVPAHLAELRLAYLPPMSGLSPREDRLEMGTINVRLGEGRTAEVLRNLCWQVLQSENGDRKWQRIAERIEALFGAKLNEPRYIKERGEVLMDYRTREGITLDLSASGRGQQQTLLLLAHMAVHPGAVLLLDEPDAHNLLVINDEAHHAWRVNWEAEGKYLRARDLKDSAEEATVWIGGLDRLHRSRGVLMSYDFSATPFTPSGKQSSEEALFGWIVSDFGLNDAIESGLVKTPRVVVRDDAVPDAKTYKSRLYHIYNDPDVKDDLNRRAQPEEPLPDLVLNAYYLLGYDWREAWKKWQVAGLPTPPVMITVANRTETAARVKHAFDSKRIHIDELCDPERVLHIDSKVLDEAEAKEEFLVSSGQFSVEDESSDKLSDDTADSKLETQNSKLTKAEQAELLRRTVDTVGKVGQPGEKIQSVISVGMLSEGWDAKTVTHVMGLRAFTSQLLCEQVVGRGLRRTSYELNPETGLFDPEYVNIFGVPFTFLPHEGGEDGPPPPPMPKTAVEPDPAKAAFAIQWPNVVRIERVFHPALTLDWSKARPLQLNAAQTAQVAELAPILEGKPDVTKIERIELERLAREFRTQRIIFETARDVFDQMKHTWQGSREVLLAQLVKIVERFIASDRITITPPLFYEDELRRRLIITLNMSRIVQHVWEAVRQENTERLTPVFDRDHPIRATGNMRTWYTGKPCERTKKSHINVCVYDSAWEASDAFALDDSDAVSAWVKNDHLGFEVLYVYRGVVRKYRPDFLVRLANGDVLVLETKGQDTEQDQVKRRYLDEWTQAVNAHGAFGRWRQAVAKNPGEIRDILAQVQAVKAEV